MQKSLLIGIFSLILLIAGFSVKEKDQLTSLLAEPTPTQTEHTLGEKDSRLFLVTKVTDGDTIQLESGQKVRYIGIDTPELKEKECFAKQAKEKNAELVAGKRVRLEKDVSETDRYGRLLRFVYLEDGTFINQVLVSEGYAQVSTFPPDVDKQDIFRQAQRTAQNQQKGLWEACSQ